MKDGKRVNENVVWAGLKRETGEDFRHIGERQSKADEAMTRDFSEFSMFQTIQARSLVSSV
jgi:hypothetical protein